VAGLPCRPFGGPVKRVEVPAPNTGPRPCRRIRARGGACDHQFHQTLLQQFARDPGATCAVYEEIRADRMTTLVEQLESET
jgi:hypothetical protein